MLGNWQEVYRAASVDARDRVFFAFSYGPFLGFWTAYEAATHLGCLAIPGGGQSSLARLETIRDNDVTVLCCTPSYAIRLAEVAREEGLDLGSLNVRRIIVAGEPGGSLPEVRRMIESEWRGAGVFDHHGMTEVGPVTALALSNRRCRLRHAANALFLWPARSASGGGDSGAPG